MRAHFESLFPKTCNNCGRVFASLRDYIEQTQRVGQTFSYDAELSSWKPSRPLGALAAANCACGTTLILSTNGTPLDQIHGVLAWLKDESEKRGVETRVLVDSVRTQVRAQVLAEPRA